MSANLLTPAEMNAAEAAWATYCAQHPVNGREGEFAGIDPTSGEVTLGRTIVEIVERRRTQGSTPPLLFKRVGFDTVYRKGHRK